MSTTLYRNSLHKRRTEILWLGFYDCGWLLVSPNKNFHFLWSWCYKMERVFPFMFQSGEPSFTSSNTRYPRTIYIQSSVLVLLEMEVHFIFQFIISIDKCIL